MENWYEKSKEALQLSGKGNAGKLHAHSPMHIEHFDNKTPDLITEEELQEYFLHCRNVLKWAPNTMRICYAGIRFFFENVLRRDWHILNIIRAQTEYRLRRCSLPKKCALLCPVSRLLATQPRLLTGHRFQIEHDGMVPGVMIPSRCSFSAKCTLRRINRIPAWSAPVAMPCLLPNRACRVPLTAPGMSHPLQPGTGPDRSS